MVKQFSCCWIIFLCVLGTTCFVLAAPPPDVLLAEFDIRPRGDLVTVPVTMKGRSYPFVLDTGASGWFVDESLRPLLGAVLDPARVATASGEIGTVRYAMPPVQLGPFAMQPRGGAVCAPFHDHLSSFGQDFYGFICTEFLRDKIFRIDFDHGKLQFLRHVSSDTGERFELRWKHGVPHVLLNVHDSGEEDFLIDTGNCGFDSGDLREELFDTLVASGRLKLLSGREVHSYSPAVGAATVPLGRLDCLTVGTFRHEGLLFTRSSLTMVGLGYLSRYAVTFDLEHSAMYLKPGRSFAKRDRYALGGIGFAKVRGKTVVEKTEVGGPAEKAGIKESDEIASVDGLPAAQTSVFELSRIFATPGKHRVRFRRERPGGTEREVTIVLTEPQEREKPDHD